MSELPLRQHRATLEATKDKPDLAAAQTRALARQIPLLYFILTANAVIVAFYTAGHAPALLTIVVPSMFCIACIGRGIVWYKRSSRLPLSHEATLLTLRNTTVLTIIFAAIFVSWALTLYYYGDDVMRIRLGFSVMVTVIGGALCLIHLPFAAFLLGVIVIAPFSVVLFVSGERTFMITGLNLILVYSAVVYIITVYNTSFEEMILSKAELHKRNAEIRQLHEGTHATEVRRRVDRQADLARIATAFTQSIAGVTTGIEEVSKHNVEQSRDVATCSSEALKNLDHVIMTAENAQSALTSVVDSTVALFAAISSIRRRTGHAAKISTVVESLTLSADEAMQRLDRTVGRIDTIATLIRTIAGQINLIALNATIEAARAGEAGRAFAVVASEIKTLAQQTAQATDDIAQHICDVKDASLAAHASDTAMKTTFLELRAATDDIANALEVQTAVTDTIHDSVTTAVDRTKVMRSHLADMSTTATRAQASARVMLGQSTVLDAETEVLGREVRNFVTFIKVSDQTAP